MIERLLRANRTVLAVPVIDSATGPRIVSATGATVSFFTPTAAILDSWRSIVTTTSVAAQLGGNITCALLDDSTLSISASDTDDELDMCAVSQSGDPLFANVEVELTGFRDKFKAATDVYNLFTQIFSGIDYRVALFDRLAKPSTDAFTIGDVVTGYDTSLDAPIDVKADRGNLKLQQSPAFNGNVLPLYTLTA